MNKAIVDVDCIKELIDIAAMLHLKGDYCSIEFENSGIGVTVWACNGAWAEGKPKVLGMFDIDDPEHQQVRNITNFKRIKSALLDLLNGSEMHSVPLNGVVA